MRAQLTCGAVCALFPPFRSGATHVVQLGPVRIEHLAPAPGDRVEAARRRAGGLAAPSRHTNLRAPSFEPPFAEVASIKSGTGNGTAFSTVAPYRRPSRRFVDRLPRMLVQRMPTSRSYGG